MPCLASTLYTGVFSRDGGKKWASRISVNSGTPVLVKAEFTDWVHCCIHPSEDAAAHARDV